MGDKRAGIVITGASTGIGRACARELAEAGFVVFAGIRDQAAGAALVAESGDAVVPIELDVTRPEQIGAAASRVGELLAGRPLAGLLNNAGITVHGPLEFVVPDELRRQLEVNLIGQLAVTQAFLPGLRAARGRIVFTGSISGLVTTPLLGPYCMSKYALEAMADALRLELAASGVRVVLLQPGTIATPIWDKAIRESRRTLAEAPPEMMERYGPLVEAVLGLVTEAQRSAKPAAVVARAARRAFTARRPKPRYAMGGNARWQRLMARLPTRWRDGLVRGLLRAARARRPA